jgi:hypothetical protein
MSATTDLIQKALAFNKAQTTADLLKIKAAGELSAAEAEKAAAEAGLANTELSGKQATAIGKWLLIGGGAIVGIGAIVFLYLKFFKKKK